VDATPDGRFFRLSGPAGWVDAALAVAAGLTAPTAPEAVPEAAEAAPALPRVFRGAPAGRRDGATRPITAPGLATAEDE
jgi:hypothetical protein